MTPVLRGSAPPMQRPTRDLVSGRHGGERVPSGGSCERRAAAGKAGAAKLKTSWASACAVPWTRRLQPRAHAPESLPCRLLPAAARRRPCPPGGTLAVRPRPETESRVGLLPVAVAHRDEPAQRPDVRRAVGPDSDRGPVVVVAEARAGEHPVDRLAGAEVDGGEVVRVGPPRGARQLRVEIEE